jgi:hypothetical protein
MSMTHSIRHVRSLAAIVIAAVAATLMMATAASAQDPYPPGPAPSLEVVCVPENPQPGQQVQCRISGAIAGETLEVTAEVGGVVFFQDTLTANQAGRANFGFRVPSDAQPGDTVTVRVVGSESGEVASDSVTVREDPAADRRAVDPRRAAGQAEMLPVTGGQVALLGALGVGLLAAGGLALRKRGDSKA